jgi:hypothetical protein
MRDARELEAALTGMRRNLAPGGVVAFDVNTLATFRRVYSSVLVVQGDREVIVLDGRGSADIDPGGTACVWIDHLSEREEGRWERRRSVHHHRHHTDAEIERAVAAAGLEVVGRWGSRIGGLEPAADEERHIKTVYTARSVRARGREGVSAT